MIKTKFCKFLYSDCICDSENCDFAHCLDELYIKECYKYNDCKDNTCKYIHPLETKQMWFHRIGVFITNTDTINIYDLINTIPNKTKLCHSLVKGKKYCNYKDCSLAHSLKEIKILNCNKYVNACFQTCIKLHNDEKIDEFLKRLNIEHVVDKYSISEKERKQMNINIKPKFLCDVLALCIKHNKLDTKIHIC